MTISDLTPTPCPNDAALDRIEATSLALCHVLDWLAGPGHAAPPRLRRALLRLSAAAAERTADCADLIRDAASETTPQETPPQGTPPHAP